VPLPIAVADLPKFPVEPWIPADRRSRTSLEIQAAEGEPAEAGLLIRVSGMRGNGRATYYTFVLTFGPNFRYQWISRWLLGPLSAAKRPEMAQARTQSTKKLLRRPSAHISSRSLNQPV
jgi:hypothetical protein